MFLKKPTTTPPLKLFILLLLSSFLILSLLVSLSSQQQSTSDDDDSSIDNLIDDSDDSGIIKGIVNYSQYSKILSTYRSTHHLITLITFSSDQELSHQCLHCKLYRHLLQKYITSYPNQLKGLLIEFTPQSQPFIIQQLKLTHLPSVTIQSINNQQQYDCNLKEYQIWECVRLAFKNTDMELYNELEHFIDMEEIKNLYLEYKSEFDQVKQQQQQGHGGDQHGGGQGLFEMLMSSGYGGMFRSLSKVLLIGCCVAGFVMGINMFQNLFYNFGGMRYTLFILCILAYILCMSGTVFNMIQNPPPYQYNPQNNEFSFFYPSMRMSFALEGYIAVFVLVISSFYFIAIPYHGYYNDNDNSNSDSNRKKAKVDEEKKADEKPKNKSKKAKNEKNKNKASSSSEVIVEEQVEEQEEKEEATATNSEDSHYKSVLKRLFFIWGFFITFSAAMIFFMIKTSFYLSETPYHGWVQLLLAIFN